MRVLSTAVTGLAFFATFAPVARAQDVFDTAPPYIAFVDGEAMLDREDLSEPAVHDVPLVPGDRIRTTRGRIEILFPDGSALDIDEYSSIDIAAPTLFRLTSGRVLLTTAGAGDPGTALLFQIDTPTASVQTQGPGEYRIAILSGPSGVETELAVVRGAGTLITDRGSMPLRAGERTTAWENGAPSPPQYFNAARFDAFDRWATMRRDERLGARSAQYLPPDLRMYGGAFDRYGAWEYDAPYGYVWYPTVAAGWRPYYDGYWASVPVYGWTWIGVDRWSWPTHHFGRWGYRGSRWFWIPERHWAPAWVSWGGAPGYVSWCPLGFDNRPVFALSISIGNSWNGWTVLSRDHFGGYGRNVRRYAVSPHTIPLNTAFVTQASAPVASPHAVPRRAVSGASQPSVVDNRRLSAFGRQATGVPQTPSADRRYGVARRQGSAEVPPAISRAPQAISRQPRVGTPPGDSPVATPPSSPYDFRNRGAYRSTLPNTGINGGSNSQTDMIYPARPGGARPRAIEPAVPGAAPPPSAPSSPYRPRYGVAAPRSDQAQRPSQSTLPWTGIVSSPRNPAAVPRYPGSAGHGPVQAAPSAPRQEQAPPPAPSPAGGGAGSARPRGPQAAAPSGGGSGESQGQQNQGGGGHGRRGPR